jgi:hypothetical protein
MNYPLIFFIKFFYIVLNIFLCESSRASNVREHTATRSDFEHSNQQNTGQSHAQSVGTLKTGYPLVQALNQDKRQDGRTCPCVTWLPSHGTGQLQSCHVSHGSSSRHQGSRQLRDRHVPRGPVSRLLARDSSETATCPLGSSSRLLALDSCKAATCPVGGSCGL